MSPGVHELERMDELARTLAKKLKCPDQVHVLYLNHG